MPLVTQTPLASLDWSFDWADFLAEVGSPQDTLSTSTWTLTPEASGSPVTDNVFGDQIAGEKTTVQVANLVSNVLYILENRVTTAQGRTQSRRFSIFCGPK